jgi:hypothetical protein
METMGFMEDALKDIEAARPVTPEALLHRAAARAMLHLADRIDYLIEEITSRGMTQGQLQEALTRSLERHE